MVEHPGRPGYEMVKRVAAVPGERVGERIARPTTSSGSRAIARTRPRTAGTSVRSGASSSRRGCSSSTGRRSAAAGSAERFRVPRSNPRFELKAGRRTPMPFTEPRPRIGRWTTFPRRRFRSGRISHWSEIIRRRGVRFPVWVVAVCVLLALSLGRARRRSARSRGRSDPEGAARVPVPGSNRRGHPDPLEPVPADPLRGERDARAAGLDRGRARGRPPGLGRHGDRVRVRRAHPRGGVHLSGRVPAERYGDRWAPVLIAWADPDDSDIPFERDDHVAAGVAVPRHPADAFEDVYVSGWVALNADDPNPPGFDLPGSSRGPSILHELGHLMGLGHVRTRGELMHPAGGGIVDLGPGDLEGLRAARRRGRVHPGDGADRRREAGCGATTCSSGSTLSG